MDEDILQRWKIVSSKAALVSLGMGGRGPAITEKAPVDNFLDSRIVIGPDGGFASPDWLHSELANTLLPVYQAFYKANPHLNSPRQFENIKPSQYLPFATTPAQRAAVQKLIEQQQLRSAP